MRVAKECSKLFCGMKGGGMGNCLIGAGRLE